MGNENDSVDIVQFKDSLVCHEAVAADVDLAAEGDEAAPAAAVAADMDVDDHEGREDGGSAGDAASAVSDEDCELGDDIGMLEDEAFRAVPEEEPDADGREAGGVGMDIDRGGGAGSSGDVGPAGPVPPPPEPVPEPRARVRRGPLAVLFVPGGKVTFYAGAKDFMTAECNNRRHGRCIKTKTCEPPTVRQAARRPGQGRPLGYLAAWLKQGLRDTPRAAHWDPEQDPTWEERNAARDEVINLQEEGSVDAALMLNGEAESPAGDGAEPAVVP